jgi:hypothetical protein
MKLSEIQELLKVPKNNTNSFGGYKYRSAEDIVEAVKKIINPAGLHLIITDEIVMVGNRVYVKATATIGEYSATGFAREEETKKGMDAAQITGSASSYARKYALNGLLAIDDTKDADATNTHEIIETPAQIAIGNVRLLKTVEELETFWNGADDELKKDKQFIATVKARKEQLKKI